MEPIYLDNNATTKPADEVVLAMTQAQQTLWANPSSVHRPGQQVRQQLELARQSAAKLIGAKPRELTFTSGGTESNNLAIHGLLGRDRPCGGLITTPIEHSAVREPAEALAAAGSEALFVELVSINQAGLVAVNSVDHALNSVLERLEGGEDSLVRSNPGRPPIVLISIQWANNETGVIQPIHGIAQVVEAARQRARAQQSGRALKIYLHVDATQAVGKLPIDVKAAGVDLLTFAAHKFHGPKGAAVLWRGRGVRLQPVQRGGPQEHEMRGGTENTAGIIGLGVAAKLTREFLDDPDARARIESMRDRFEARIQAALPETVINSASPTPRLWNTTNLAFPGLEAEAILLGLSEKGLCASAGAACSSGSLDPSPVLRAMGVDEPTAHGSVRFSLSRYTTELEIDRAIEIVQPVVENLRATMPLAG